MTKKQKQLIEENELKVVDFIEEWNEILNLTDSNNSNTIEV